MRLASFAAWGLMAAGLGAGHAPGDARADGGDFWRRVADPQAHEADALVTRASAHLDRSLYRSSPAGGPPSGPARDQAVRAELLLEQALARKPQHYRALLLRGDALAMQGRRADAIAAFERACPRAPLPEDGATCTLRLAIEQSRAGRLDQALAIYDRALEQDGRSSAAYLNSAEVLMAKGPPRLSEALGRYRQAVALEDSRPAGPERDEGLALALYGLAVALDRDGQPARAGEIMTRAVRLDPRLRLLDAASEGGGNLFFVPAGDAHYYRGLALAALGRPREAAFAFRHFLVEAGGSPYATVAQSHLGRLGRPAELRAAAGDGGPPATPPAPPVHPPVTRRWRLVAAATVESEGPIPAPMLDAAWKGRPRLFEPCFEEAPALPTRTVRLTINLRIDGRGVITKVDATVPPEWPDAARCLMDRMRSVRIPRPPRPEPTTAKLALMVSMNGKT